MASQQRRKVDISKEVGLHLGSYQVQVQRMGKVYSELDAGVVDEYIQVRICLYYPPAQFLPLGSICNIAGVSDDTGMFFLYFL